MMAASWRLNPKKSASNSSMPSRSARASDIVFVAELVWRFPGREQLLVSQRADGFDTASEVAPELLNGTGARHPKSHANDGNIGRRGINSFAHGKSTG